MTTPTSSDDAVLAYHSELDTLTMRAMRAHALGFDCALTDPPAAAQHFAEAALCHAEAAITKENTR